MSARTTALAGQVLSDLVLVSLLALVTGLMGLRSVVRGARAIGLLPPKELSVVC